MTARSWQRVLDRVTDMLALASLLGLGWKAELGHPSRYVVLVLLIVAFGIGSWGMSSAMVSGAEIWAALEVGFALGLGVGFGAGLRAGLTVGLGTALVVGIGFWVGVLLAAGVNRLRNRSAGRAARLWISRSVALGLVSIAVAVGGQARAWRGEEFRGNHEEESSWTQVPLAAGLIRWAVTARLRDLGRLTGRALDWGLARPRTEYLCGALAIVTAAYLFSTAGLAGLVQNLDNVLAAASLLYGTGWFLRRERDVPPVERRARSRPPG